MKLVGKENMNKYGIIIALIIVISAFAGCLDSDTNTESEDIKIGVTTPLTGDAASWGEMQKRATELALEDFNSAGGINGRKIKVIYEDDQADPKEGVNAFKKLVGVDKVSIVVGSPASGVTLSVAPIANQAEVVLLSSGSTSTDVGKAGPYVFRIMPSDEIQSSIMADWAWDLGYRNISVIYVENSWGRGLMEAFTKDFTDKGGEIDIVEAADPEASDFRTQLTKIKSLNPDAIYAPLYQKGAGLMIKQARELGLEQQILGADVYGTPELIEAGGTAVEGVLYTTFGEYHGPEYQSFAEKYKEKYGLDLETYTSYCYDAFVIALEAIKRIPSEEEINGSNIREELLKIEDYRGVTGLTTFAGGNSATGKTFDKMMVKDGKHVPYLQTNT